MSVVELLRLVRQINKKDKPIDVRPAVCKPLFSVILSALAVLGFGINPLDSVMSAFGGGSVYGFTGELKKFADFVITTLLLAGGSASVRLVASGIQKGLGVPTTKEIGDDAQKADTKA